MASAFASRLTSPELGRLLWSTVAPLSLAALGVGWGVASLSPGSELPAWPAMSLGFVALALSFRRGPALPRAIASLLGTLAVTVGAAQIAVLWVAANAAESYM